MKLYIIMVLLFLGMAGMTQEYTVVKDTIKPVLAGCDGYKETDSYETVHGIRISKFYRIIDSLTFDINNDHKPDNILILSPVTQENRDTLRCETRQLKRLLVVLTSAKDNYSIGLIKPDIVLNKYDYMSDPFRHIKNIGNGFRIFFEFGSIICCSYYFDFVLKNKVLILHKRESWFFNKGNPALEKKETTVYEKKNLPLNTVNINDFIGPVPDLVEK